MKKFSFILLAIAVVLSGCDLLKKPDTTSGSFTDSRDNHSYKWIKIGDQSWMTENLAWLPAVSLGITGSSTAPFYYVHGYQGINPADAKITANYTTYGVLYNWTAAQSACPSGWHLPTDAEWTILTDFLGGTAVAGTKMKSLTGWFNGGNGDNSSGFNGLPAGGRDHALGFGALNYLGVFHSATENSATTAWYRGLSTYETKVNRNTPEKADGYSVRCVKN